MKSSQFSSFKYEFQPYVWKLVHVKSSVPAVATRTWGRCRHITSPGDVSSPLPVCEWYVVTKENGKTDIVGAFYTALYG